MKIYRDIENIFEWRLFTDGRIQNRRYGERLWGPSSFDRERLEKMIGKGLIVEAKIVGHKAKRRGWIRASVG